VVPEKDLLGDSLYLGNRDSVLWYLRRICLDDVYILGTGSSVLCLPDEDLLG
jgi:hypothetical protein